MQAVSWTVDLYCCKCPLRRFVKVIGVYHALLYASILVLSLYFYLTSTSNSGYFALATAIPSGTMLLFVLLYLRGLSVRDEWSMVPFIVCELIFKTFYGVALIFAWLALIVQSCTDLFAIDSPNEAWISNKAFLPAVCVIATLLYFAHLPASLQFYAGYRAVGKENIAMLAAMSEGHYKPAEEIAEQSLDLGHCAKPIEI